jgi:hypothetical protein
LTTNKKKNKSGRDEEQKKKGIEIEKKEKCKYLFSYFLVAISEQSLILFRQLMWETNAFLVHSVASSFSLSSFLKTKG